MSQTETILLIVLGFSLATLIALFLARGLCYLISIDSISITDEAYTVLAQTRIHFWPEGPMVSISAILALVVLVLAIWTAHGTEFGRTVYSPIDEQHPTEPTDMNGIDKLAAEKYYRLYSELYGLWTSSLRISNTYGPRAQMRHDLPHRGRVRGIRLEIADRPCSGRDGRELVGDLVENEFVVGHANSVVMPGLDPGTHL